MIKWDKSLLNAKKISSSSPLLLFPLASLFLSFGKLSFALSILSFFPPVGLLLLSSSPPRFSSPFLYSLLSLLFSSFPLLGHLSLYSRDGKRVGDVDDDGNDGQRYCLKEMMMAVVVVMLEGK